MAKLKVGTEIEASIWREFAAGCKLRGLSISEMITRLIVQQLKRWKKEKAQ